MRRRPHTSTEPLLEFSRASKCAQKCSLARALVRQLRAPAATKNAGIEIEDRHPSIACGTPRPPPHATVMRRGCVEPHPGRHRLAVALVGRHEHPGIEVHTYVHASEDGRVHRIRPRPRECRTGHCGPHFPDNRPDVELEPLFACCTAPTRPPSAAPSAHIVEINSRSVSCCPVSVVLVRFLEPAARGRLTLFIECQCRIASNVAFGKYAKKSVVGLTTGRAW